MEEQEFFLVRLCTIQKDLTFRCARKTELRATSQPPLVLFTCCCSTARMHHSILALCTCLLLLDCTRVTPSQRHGFLRGFTNSVACELVHHATTHRCGHKPPLPALLIRRDERWKNHGMQMSSDKSTIEKLSLLEDKDQGFGIIVVLVLDGRIAINSKWTVR